MHALSRIHRVLRQELSQPRRHAGAVPRGERRAQRTHAPERRIVDDEDPHVAAGLAQLLDFQIEGGVFAAAARVAVVEERHAHQAYSWKSRPSSAHRCPT